MAEQDQGRSEQDRLNEGVASMAELVMSEETLASVLDLVLRIVVNVIDGADAAGVSLRRAGRLVTIARTSAVVDQLDGARQQGPTHEAFTSGETVRISDIAADERWPAFAAKAAEEGIVSTLAVPLAPVAEPIGVLTVHASRTGAFGADQEQIAFALARQAAIAIANVGSFGDSEHTNEQLRDALQSRDLIGQAKGILMEREGVSADDAFEQMRKASQTANRKLRDIAGEIVRRVTDRRRA